MAASPLSNNAGLTSSSKLSPTSFSKSSYSLPHPKEEKKASHPSITSHASIMHDDNRQPKRIDTLDLKHKLNTALGFHANRYWSTLAEFMKGKIDRIEFEEEAMKCLKPPYIHLHNSLVLGLLYNASADVPGPSTGRAGVLHPLHDGNRFHPEDDDEAAANMFSDTGDDDLVLQPPAKRLRLLTAGLSRKDRARIRSIPKSLHHARSLGGGDTSSLGWAGAGAELLEKKRKEEEKRKSASDKKRAKEAYTEVGAPDWKVAALQSASDLSAHRDRLAISTQQEVVRAQAAPLCVECKQLPDLETMRDIMTLHAVESGLLKGAQPQAAALLLAALQCHLQNVMASIITKIRANRQKGIRTTGNNRSASDEYTLLSEQVPQAGTGADDSHDESIEQQSPVHVSRPLRSSAQDVSSVSSSSASQGIGNSLGDTSMASLVSTAPTSVPAGSISSESAATNSAGASATNKHTREGESAEDEEVNEGTTSSEARSTDLGSSSLELRHLAFLLDVAPHTIVESLGQGSQERLLAADWTLADEDAQRSFEWTAEGSLQRQVRSAALSTLSDALSNAQGQAPSAPSTRNAPRNRNVIDQLAPMRVLDRRTLAETQAVSASVRSAPWHATKGGLSLPGTAKEMAKLDDSVGKEGPDSGATDENNGDSVSGVHNDTQISSSNFASAAAAIAATSAAGSHHHRGPDPHLHDVVNPVAILSSHTG